MAQKYFTLHGNQKEGWSLNVYNIDLGGCVAPFWGERKIYNTLEEVLMVMKEIEQEIGNA